MPTLSSSTPAIGTLRRNRLSFLVALLIYLRDPSLAPVQCLPHHTVLSFIGRLPSTPSPQTLPILNHRRHRLVKILPEIPPRRRQPILLPFAKLYLFFDKFIHPYGVNNETLFDNNINNNGNDGDGVVVELLDALLPRLRTKEDKSRILEGFQRARLDEQLRLSKLSRREARREDVGTYHDDNQREEEEEEEETKMADLFQKARLAEQLRLSMNRRVNGETQSSSDFDGTKEFIFDKDEAIHRALLEERLRIQRFQQRQQAQRNNIVAYRVDSIERAMVEYETENEKERSTLQLTMVQENESEVNDSDDRSSECDSKKEKFDSIILRAMSPNSHDRHSNHAIVSQLSVNQTDDESFKHLNDKLKQLHRMVVISSSSSSASSNDATRRNATPTMRNILLTTYLPLPPREDASYISIVLAPVAHLLSAMFLLGSAVFYAVIAVLDVICNDDKDKYSTQACLRTTSHVLRSCWEYLFPEKARTGSNWRAAAKRTMRALQSSVLASFYAVQCVLMRAIGHSKYATSCMDAGTGSIRYLVYMIRSLQVLWNRVVNVVQNRDKSQSRIERSKQSKMKFNPLRVLSNIKLPILRPSRNHRSLKDEQQRLRSNEIYNDKLRLLNLERVNIERDRHQLLQAQRQLEYEKQKLLVEGVNVLSWYLAAGNAAAAAAAAAETTRESDTTDKRKRYWNIWWLGKNNAEGLERVRNYWFVSFDSNDRYVS